LRDDDDRSIRFLLAGGRLSGADHDRIVERLRRPQRARTRAPGWLLGLGALASVGAIAVAIGLRRPGDERGALTAKGAAPAGPVLEARCPDRPRGVCRLGDRLIFEVGGAPAGALLAAWAERAGGERIWYFPTRDGRLASVPAGAGPGLVAEAARIGPEHAPGRYTLHLVVVAHAVDRAALVGGGVRSAGEASLPLEVTP
jgi:hypothetical protein